MNVGHQIKKDFRTMADSEGYGKIVISALIGAALGITVTYSTGVASNKNELIRLSVQLEALTNSVQVGMVDRYKGADARRDFALITSQLDAIREKNGHLEKEFDLHMREMHNK